MKRFYNRKKNPIGRRNSDLIIALIALMSGAGALATAVATILLNK